MAYESRLSLTVDSRTGERNLKRFRGELDQTENRGKKAFTNIKGLVVGLSGALAGLGATRYFNSIVRDAQEFESRMLSINALIKANGSAAGFTAATLRDQAEQLALTTLQSTRGVLDAQKVLLSFRRVSGSAFTQAIELSADLSAVMGTDMSSAALQLGKALENPVEGMSALSRSGTTFTQTQKDAVKAMVETNRLAEAQALILAEVRSQVGGAGAGQAQGLAGAFDTLGQRIEEFGLAAAGALDSGGRLANIINRIAEGLNKVNETIDPDPANRIFELLQKEIDLRAQLAELKSDDSLFGAPAAEIERVESQINSVYEERMALLEQEAREQQAQADAVIASREKQLQMEEEAAAERLRIEREKQAELARIAEESRLASVNGIITQLQNEALALQLSDRALLQHQLNVAGATEQERELALATHDAVKALTEQAEAAEKSAEAFINPWQSAADTVAQSLQDAIASGDWDDIGDAIGGALGSSIAAVVNKQITDSLAKNLTANSSTLAQIGGAFAGPIAGAVAGGAIQLAVSELSDFFSGSDWDPTAARQAAQGAGTVLGSIDAKSESIRRAVEGSESGIGQLVGINQNMLRALQGLLAGISGASTMVARGYGGLSMPTDFSRTISGSDFNLTGGIMPIFDETLGMAFDFFDEMSSIFTFGMFDLGDALGSVFGGSRKVKDLGIQFFGATLDEMIRGWRDGDRYLTAQAYATIEQDGGWFGSDDRWDDFQRLGPEAENQISLVFAGIRDSVTAGAEALGMADSEINSALSRFRVETQKISLENLSAEEQAAELEAVFSSIFDQAAGAVVPYLDEFQRAGEGLGETLSRVANQTLITQEAVNRLGIRFSDLAGRELVVASERLMDAAGGVEQFITSMQGFIANFASDAQKFELAYSDITRALEQSNLTLPSTRDGYYDLLQAQNGATAAGAENIATLLRLQGVADQYYTFLEDAQKSAVDTQVELLQIQRSAISESLREAERASNSVSRALAGLTVQSSSFSKLSRDAALASLQAMAASGRIGDQGQLDRALSAATNIQAGEFSTMNDYIRGVSRTGETLRDLKWVADQQLTREQRSLANIERQMEAMNEEISAVGRATAKHTAKTAKLLERIEVEGLEVRE
ncbi:phage tail length tape measure family protein [Marinobacter nauticus]|uniref:Uncharacterized protein n=1 Tax=Marinobacter nauticus TaxID=2743 RepID=A0A1M2V0Z0_MARNT|nr:phage tail length tape measure family protein [Marinobacter nauticus]OJT01236.1 hypothetical protein BEE62_14905 [Marinobacter nauticus]